MDYEQFILVFTAIIYEAIPFVVLGVVIAGILEEYVPQQLMSTIFQGRLPESFQNTAFGTLLAPFVHLLQFRLVAIIMGGLLGLIFPMCECGIIAVMRRLIRKGVPLSVCICYMLCGPIINVVVILSTFVAFNPPSPEDYVLGGPVMVVLLRCGIGLLIGCITSLVVEWQYRIHGNSLVDPSLVVSQKELDDLERNAGNKTSFMQKLGNISETALHDFVDITAFLILGAALAAFGRSAMDQMDDLDTYIQSAPAVAILIMMGIAILFCLCSEADAFVAANFPAAWPPAAKMAFLVLGPMFDIKLYVMYTRIFRRRLIFTIVGSVIIQVFVYMLILHYVWPDAGYSETFLQRQQRSP